MPSRFLPAVLSIALFATPAIGQRQERFAVANNGPSTLVLGTSNGERFGAQ